MPTLLSGEQVDNPGVLSGTPHSAPLHTPGVVASRTHDYFCLGGLLAAHVQNRVFAVATSDFISPHS